MSGLPSHTSRDEEIPDMEDYEDIDEIYDFVRGIKPSIKLKQQQYHLEEKKRQLDNENKKNMILMSPDLIPASSVPKFIHMQHPNPGCFPKSPSKMARNTVVNEDEPPEPPPIETIPTKMNNYGSHNSDSKHLLSSNCNNSSSHNNKSDDQEGITHTQIQIQIRSTGHEISSGGGMCRNRQASPSDRMRNGKKPNFYYNKDAPFSSNSTSTNNTSGSSSAGIESSCRNPLGGARGSNSKGHLYVKHNSGSNNSHNNSSSENRLFARSPIFNCRYKSMNDLNRSSLDSSASGGHNMNSGSSNHINCNGGSNNNNRGKKHGYVRRHSYHPLNVSVGNLNGENNNKGYSREGLKNPLSQSSNNSSSFSNLSNILNLKSARPVGNKLGLFRPRSLTNLLSSDVNDSVFFSPPSKMNKQSGSVKNSGSHHLGGCRKKLTDMVMPSHHHAPPPPPIELMSKAPLKPMRTKLKNPATLYL